jgi:hypothetical protein
VLGSERLTGATLDRLTHRCRIIETKGESYRLQDAKARTRHASQQPAPQTATLWTKRKSRSNFKLKVLPVSTGALLFSISIHK